MPAAIAITVATANLVSFFRTFFILDQLQTISFFRIATPEHRLFINSVNSVCLCKLSHINDLSIGVLIINGDSINPSSVCASARHPYNQLFFAKL